MSSPRDAGPPAGLGPGGNGAREEPGGSDAIQQTLLGSQVYDLLWQRIIRHQLRPGDKLSDLRLSEELGVSRTPVREALQRLAQDGIVRAEHRRGFYVAHFSRADVREIYDVRTALEVLAVHLALPQLTDAELDAAQAALDDIWQRLEAGDPTVHEAFLPVDRAFHELLVRVAGNRRLEAMMTALQAQVRVFQFYGIHFQQIMKNSLAQHQAILTAMQQRDQTAAEAAMAGHIQAVKEWVLTEFVTPEDP
ncbi:MAG TPA: GntR family transcriptional regulator [Chloroflexia bacterium]|nr:GntR family transcriptional regulator [Chloroflexia bacterium]